MNRVAEIADYLLSTSIGDTEAAWKAEVLGTIAARWPDVGEAELTAAFLMTMAETAIRVLDAVAEQNQAEQHGRGPRPDDGSGQCVTCR